MSLPPFPRMMPARQFFPAPPALNLSEALGRELARFGPRLRPGARIAVGVGSRGISNLLPIVRAAIEYLKGAGVEPFVVPAMGSHGGATPAGQLELLAEYGITEAALGVPIDAAMEAQKIGASPDGVKVYFANAALAADGVLVINRVKPHTDFQSVTIGSGLLKMLVVGLGKQLGAANFHTYSSRIGYEHMLRASAKVTLSSAPILGGLAIVEDQYHATSKVAAVLPEEMEAREAELYREARRLMPQLPFEDIDLLIIDHIGKNISGSGMDPNVIGRSLHGYSALLSDRSTRPVIRRIFVRDLTPESHGNGVGVGLADFTTARLVRGIDQRVTYLNSLTAMSMQGAKIPIHFETDREAIGRALESLALPDTAQAKVLRIHNTLSLEHVEVSEAFGEELKGRPEVKAQAAPAPMRFDAQDNLQPLAE
ncbi:MAG TPA: DUF362 domain-containing protein [Candidatus Saccharimonadales bacterium]|nr:DUF362 domain-containing protein [Candidatus Saccharimonadales bacterium]